MTHRTVKVEKNKRRIKQGSEEREERKEERMKRSGNEENKTRSFMSFRFLMIFGRPRSLGLQDRL